ncbi:MAG: dihydrofolate reductase family protein [Sporichthyaceae bacterium]|nr:dihydrofolate reductase family protein [Sporichthyaceae bacterium]
MGKIIVTEFVTLDGVIESPGGGEGFKHEQWSFAFDRGAEGNQYKLDETLDSAAILLGRRTYELFAASWPTREGEFADTFNSLPKYVVSSTLDNPEWTNTQVLDGDPVAAVSKLKAEIDGNIVVHGSAQLVQTLIENDLVDELRLMVFPVVLGTGKRLFGDTSDKKMLRLADSKIVGEGVAILTYRPAQT